MDQRRLPARQAPTGVSVRASTLVAKALEHVQRGELAEADSLAGRAARLEPDNFDAAHLFGALRLERGDVPTAYAHLTRAIGLRPGSAPAHFNLGIAARCLDRLEEALASFEHALAIDGTHVLALVNRGHVLGELQRADEALASYDAALAMDACAPAAWHGRGVALQELGRTAEALGSYERALALDPAHLPSLNNRFDCHLSLLEDPQAIVAQAMEVAHANLAAHRAPPERLSALRLAHDLEQCRHLAALGDVPEGLHAMRQALEQLHARPRPPGASVRIDRPQRAAIAKFHDALHVPRLAEVAACLNPDNDWAAIERRYLESSPELVAIDDFLSPAALAALREFCLAATVWKTEYDGYLGAFANQGFMSPLHLRIAAELKQRMPRIFGPHALEQLWGFKYDANVAKGIRVHADFARVNLNFWITPDSANLDPQTGGLLVYDAPAPASWGLAQYNGDAATIREHLRSRGARCERIPYRCNRAVLFNSNLFHETDTIRFAGGYEQRRINVTYLFGRGLKV